MPRPATRALFINGGILGLRTFARFVDDAFVRWPADIEASQTILSDGLTTGDRVLRRLLCTRLWNDGWAGVKNLDLHRWRAEFNAGLVARHRIRELESVGGRFDVLHFHRQATAYASVARMRETPSIVSMDCTQRPLVEAAQSALERRTYAPNVKRDGEIFRAARLIVCTSQWAADSVRSEYPDCETEIAVMPDPVLLDLFDPAWPEARHARWTADPNAKPRVLFIGGDFPRKGGYDLLDAWRRGRLWERASLDLVTGWPIAADALPPGVTLHNSVAAHSDAWRALWRNADLFVLSTRDEAFGLVFQEAAAAGLPAVGTRINAIPELVLHDETGLLVPPGDPDALVTAMDRLIASEEMRRFMGARARALVERAADPDRYRDRLSAAILKLAGR
jgi:glycosyltransferase involved in cell wall biosynthesis